LTDHIQVHTGTLLQLI